MSGVASVVTAERERELRERNTWLGGWGEMGFHDLGWERACEGSWNERFRDFFTGRMRESVSTEFDRGWIGSSERIGAYFFADCSTGGDSSLSRSKSDSVESVDNSVVGVGESSASELLLSLPIVLRNADRTFSSTLFEEEWDLVRDTRAFGRTTSCPLFFSLANSSSLDVCTMVDCSRLDISCFRHFFGLCWFNRILENMRPEVIE